jgi:exodeoxyribonuclease-3
MAKKRKLRIASYNINGINTRLHVLARWLEEFQPDVVGLQELKCTDEAFPAEAVEALGYSAIWHGQRSWNGVALLSRVGDPVATRRALPNDPNLEQSRYIEAAVCGILVGNLYAPNGNPSPGPKFDYKLAWLDRLKEHAQELLDSGVPAILIGDFNVIPTEQDVYKPERWTKDALFAPEARQKYRELAAEGWTDAIRHVHPDERIYTFWHYWRNSFERDAGIRIDHALLSPSLAKKLKAVGVDREPRGWEKTSDHAPMWVEVEVYGSRRGGLCGGCSRSGKRGRIGHAEALLSLIEQPLEPRIVTQQVEIGVGFGDSDLVGACLGQRALEHAECAVLVVQVAGENAGEIVSHVEIVGIDEQRSRNPLPSPFLVTKQGMAAGENSQSRAIAWILLHRAFALRHHHPSRVA